MNEIKKVSVFGGSSPQPGSDAYQQAHLLGKRLGQAGMTVLTGGYMGTMEAVSQGASEMGALVIGVTSEELEKWRAVKVNQWVEQEQRCQSFRERLNFLVDQCDAAVALPGGIGTLLEICLTWNLMVIEAIKAKPLILMGEEWHRLIETFYKELGPYIRFPDREYIAFAPNPNAVIDLLNYFSGHCS
ncbi:MAG: LOG family protein [Anaerolineales bacterium]